MQAECGSAGHHCESASYMEHMCRTGQRPTSRSSARALFLLLFETLS